MSDENLVCPECGEPIGVTSAYCMHCSADLTEKDTGSATAADEGWNSDHGDDGGSVGSAIEEAIADATSGADDDPGGDTEATASPGDLPPELRSNGGAVGTPRLEPGKLLLKAVGVVLSIGLGFAVGLGSAVALTAVIANDLAFLVGIVVWFGVTATCFRLAPI
ncbi:hypothetical protein GCM10028857_09010 [Salinarchaeum chitinilyticum]